MKITQMFAYGNLELYICSIAITFFSETTDILALSLYLAFKMAIISIKYVAHRTIIKPGTCHLQAGASLVS